MHKSKEPLGKKIVHSGKEIHLFLTERLSKLSIGSGQFFLILRIYENEGICQEDLSKAIRLDKTTIAKSIKRLISEGYLRKEKDKKDKRYYCLYTTDKGKDIYPKMIEILKEAEKDIMSGFSCDELELFVSFIERINDNIKKK